jgi:hypothetical protein
MHPFLQPMLIDNTEVMGGLFRACATALLYGGGGGLICCVAAVNVTDVVVVGPPHTVGNTLVTPEGDSIPFSSKSRLVS